jgi:hypothetical protein
MSYIPVTIICIIAGIIVGVLVYFYPVSVMKFQVKFYEKINWRIEPISLQKEFKRTKYSGLYLVFLCLLASVYIKFFMR